MASIVGVDVGATGVRAIEVSTSGKSLVVRKAGVVPLPHGTVVAGAVTDPVQVTAALKALWRKHRFSTRNVALVVGGHQSVLARPAQVHYLPNPAHFRRMVLSEAKDVLPISMEALYVDFHTMAVRTDPTEDNPTRQMADVMIIGVERTIVDALVRPVEQAGLYVTSIDIAPFALTRLVAAAQSGPGKLDLIVHFGAETVLMVGTVDGQTKLIRPMNEYNGKNITLQMQDAFDLALDEAERVKIDTSPDVEMGVDSDAVTIISTWVAAIVREIRSTATQATQGLGVPIGRIWLSGGGARLGGLARRLAAETDVQVSVLDPRAWTTKPERLKAAYATGQDLALALAAGGK